MKDSTIFGLCMTMFAAVVVSIVIDINRGDASYNRYIKLKKHIDNCSKASDQCPICRAYVVDKQRLGYFVNKRGEWHSVDEITTYI